jgi:basic membrane lipoprotein Med (substrate-binding protein (PBP1-ABC) superfamily)
LKKVDQAVSLTVRDTARGHFKAGDHRFTLATNSTGIGKVSSVVPASIIAQANQYKALIASGKIVPPENIQR